MFKKRLEWEVKKGRITREEADAWIFAPNSKVSCFPKSRLTAQEMREALGWIKQTDGVSCGPLALAACLLILQGFRPTAEALGWNPKKPEKSAQNLRHSLLLRTLAIGAEEYGEGSWVADPGIKSSLLPYLPVSEQIAL
jgi:hypothetical protein